MMTVAMRRIGPARPQKLVLYPRTRSPDVSSVSRRIARSHVYILTRTPRKTT
jgi:hypothetical protein